MTTLSTDTIASAPCWILRNDTVEVAVTHTGGHMAPVTFDRRSARPIRPYYINPWHGEELPIDEPVLPTLRGDFFCLPFGANAEPWRRERHVLHGEPATRPWKLVESGRAGPITSLTLTMATKARPGVVTKRLYLADGHNVVYLSHVLTGFSGAMPLGHHATLAVPDSPGGLRIATSRIRFGMTPPEPIDDPTIGHYQSFRPGRRFKGLSRVPLKWIDDRWADATAYPAREGFTDFLALFNAAGPTPAWTTAVNTVGRYLWFSLKDPAVLPTTAVWASNKGRHSLPWCGRNRCLGLEDVCGYFAEGLAPSLRRNILRDAGIHTAVKLSKRRPTVVNYIQGAVPVPRGFDRVRNARFAPGSVTFRSYSNETVTVPVDHAFLATGELG